MSKAIGIDMVCTRHGSIGPERLPACPYCQDAYVTEIELLRDALRKVEQAAPNSYQGVVAREALRGEQ